MDKKYFIQSSLKYQLNSPSPWTVVAVNAINCLSTYFSTVSAGMSAIEIAVVINWLILLIHLIKVEIKSLDWWHNKEKIYWLAVQFCFGLFHYKTAECITNCISKAKPESVTSTYIDTCGDILWGLYLIKYFGIMLAPQYNTIVPNIIQLHNACFYVLKNMVDMSIIYIWTD